MLASARPAGGDGVTHGPDHKSHPWKKSGQDDGEEEPPRLHATVLGGREALPVLVDEIKVRPLRVALRRHDMPWQRNQQEDQRTGWKVHGAQPSPLVEYDEPGEHDRAGEKKPDQ